ncbi:MAG: DoxX family protein [Acidobacteria bacterium]|nr:DoxX family protein [Acidobacteriota bacterium]
MNTYLGKYSEHAFALMRIVVGLLFALHGAQKLFGVLGGTKVPLFSLYGAAGVIEFFGGLLIALGLLGSWAAFVASGQMAAALRCTASPSCTSPFAARGSGASTPRSPASSAARLYSGRGAPPPRGTTWTSSRH